MGRKRIRIDTKFQRKRYAGDDDRLSELPADILIIILSKLSLKEAACTSVISSCWRNLWKYISCLNLQRKSQKHNPIFLSSERRKYLKWLRCVLRSHKLPILKEFKLCFPLNRSNSIAITRSLEFAFARKVERFELDFRYDYASDSKHYCLPEELFRAPSRMPLDCTSLKALSLKGLDVSGGAIDFFLRNCPLLEELVVHQSSKISNHLEVCGSSLVLKRLEIAHCWGLESLKVSAPSLTSLEVTMLERLSLENVPMLVEVTVTCPDNTSLKHVASALSCCLPQLETLCLMLGIGGDKIEFCNFPVLPKLKKLVVDYAGRGNESLIKLTSLIRRSPYLEEFVLKYSWYQLTIEHKHADAIRFPHQHLKVVKFSGYYGRTNDLQLVRYLLENSLVLEKIIIDPSGGPINSQGLDMVEQTARANAKRQLESESQLPQHIELIIL